MYKKINQDFSTWVYSNSTGVALPNMETATFSLDLSASTSSTMPLNEAKGPSATLTVSPISKDMVETTLSTPSLI